jgi:hypothetical protein
VVVSVATVPRSDGVAVAISLYCFCCFLHRIIPALFNHYVSAVEARLMCGLVGQSKFAMSSSEIDLELRPCFGRYLSRLPCTAGVGKQSCIKYESACNINDHGSTVRLASCNRESSCVLNLLKKHLDRLIRIIRRVESLVVLREFSRCNHSVVC